MQPVIPPEHPIFRLIICYAFSRGERAALAMMTGAPVVTVAREKTPPEQKEVIEEVKAALLNGWDEAMDSIQAQIPKESSLFHAAANAALVASARRNDVRAALLAIDKHGATNVRVAIYQSARKGNLSVLDLLMEHPAASYMSFYSSMYCAAERGQLESIRAIRRARPETKSLDILGSAAEGGRNNVIKTEISERKEFPKDEIEGAFEIAAFGGHVETLQLLERLGAKNYESALAEASIAGKIIAIQWLLERSKIGIDNAFVRAAINNRVQAMSLLIENGATAFEAALSRIMTRHNKRKPVGAIRLLSKLLAR